MPCNLKIVPPVTGQKDWNGKISSITINGEASGCDTVIVEIKCGATHRLEARVEHSDHREPGAFTAVFPAEDARLAECQCGGQIVVLATCADDEECRSPVWTGTVDCSDYESPEITVIPGLGDGDAQPAKCADNKDNIGDCKIPTVAPGPQYRISFHQIVTFLPLATFSPELQEGASERLPVLQGAQFNFADFQYAAMTVQLGSLLQFEQRWFFQNLYVSDVVSSIALAPTEELTLSIKKTQRKQFTQRTLDSVEELESRESRHVDKDVLNVTRASSRTQTWSMAANASLSLGGIFGLGGNVGYTDTINRSANSSSQKVQEATRKSAHSLKTIQKTEVEEVSELITEDSTLRKIGNPYRDRSLLIKVFDMEKHYCVENVLTDVVPVLNIRLIEVLFDRDFVLNHRRFLSETLLDSYLAGELIDTLDYVMDEAPIKRRDKAIRIACLALAHLFETDAIFNVPGYTSTSGFPFSAKEFNDPASSFNAGEDAGKLALGDRPVSGFDDALHHGFGQILTALGFFFRIYKDEIVPLRAPGAAAGVPVPLGTPDELLAVDLAVAIEAQIAPLWSGNVDLASDDVKGVLDQHQMTEVFRRLTGFLGFVNGVLRPLVQPLEDDKERWEAARRAELTIVRVQNHLRAYGAFYTRKFLEFASDQTHSSLVRSVARQVLQKWLVNAGEKAQAEALFDPETAFIDGDNIVVPFKRDLDRQLVASMAPAFFKNQKLDAKSLGIGTRSVYPDPVEVPFDGIHVEAIPGACAPLPGLETDDALSAEVSFEAKTR